MCLRYESVKLKFCNKSEIVLSKFNSGTPSDNFDLQIIPQYFERQWLSGLGFR